MLLEESLAEFLFECEIRKYTWKTIKGYRNGLGFLMNYLKNEHDLTRLEEIQTNFKHGYSENSGIWLQAYEPPEQRKYLYGQVGKDVLFRKNGILQHEPRTSQEIHG